jgi:[ribosomal protein S18]-alanine N-acetyltransferase
MDEVRVLRSSDIEAIRQIAKQVFPKLWSEKDFAYFLTHDCGWCRGIFRSGVLIAYCISLVIHGEMDLVSIATEPSLQRKGLAERLIRLAEEAPGVSRILLEVNTNNTAAIRFYEKVGFLSYGKRLKYYEGKEDALLMNRVLS